MNKNVDSRKAAATVIIVLGIAVLVIIIILLTRKGANNTANKSQNTVNYQTATDGSKVNVSQSVASDKTVGDVKIEKSRIVYQNGMTKLTSVVTNNGADIDNLSFTVKFVGNDGSELISLPGYVGKIKQGETRYIDSNTTGDYTNAADIQYTVSK